MNSRDCRQNLKSLQFAAEVNLRNRPSGQEILFPIAEKLLKKATADDKNLKINSIH